MTFSIFHNLWTNNETHTLFHFSYYSRSSHRKCSIRKCVLRNFIKFRGKHLCQSLFFNKVAGLRSATLLKKRLWHRCFPVNFAKFLKTPFSHNTSGRLLLLLHCSGKKNAVDYLVLSTCKFARILLVWMSASNLIST